MLAAFSLQKAALLVRQRRERGKRVMSWQCAAGLPRDCHTASRQVDQMHEAGIATSKPARNKQKVLTALKPMPTNTLLQTTTP